MASIMIVPGIGGNELHTLSLFFGLGPPQTIWLNRAVILAGGWRWLALAADGASPAYPFTQPLYAGCPLPKYYGAAEIQLTELGWDVRGARLDWRRDLETSAAQLVERLIYLQSEAPFHLLAHSRGGLVTRLALSELAASGQLGLVGRVAGLGVPHFGAWDAAGLVAGWEDSIILLTTVIHAIYGPLIGAAAASALQGAVRSWPAAYQLMPAPTAPGLLPEQAAAIYDSAAWAAVGVTLPQSWLTRARDLWPQIPPPPASVEWLDVVGTGVMTPLTLVGGAPPATRGQITFGAAGDGSVPQLWAALAPEAAFVTHQSHADLPGDPSVLKKVSDFFAAAN